MKRVGTLVLSPFQSSGRVLMSFCKGQITDDRLIALQVGLVWLFVINKYYMNSVN